MSAVRHYWHGTKLLWTDTKISSKLLLKLINGKEISRREQRQLTRTTSDILKLVPFSVFIVVPFMEFLIPILLKVFPNMIPSTFKGEVQNNVNFYRTLFVELLGRITITKFNGQRCNVPIHGGAWFPSAPGYMGLPSDSRVVDMVL